MENLNFMATVPVAEFKMAAGAGALQIIKNPHTDKLFFKCGTLSGKVAQKGYKPNPVVSTVVDAETGEEFYMLHNAANVNVVEEL
jgi:hypothetical protein